RFKSPELLLLSDWLAGLPPPFADPAAASEKLLQAFAGHLGRTLAAAHATPLVAPEGGRWAPRRPRLASAEAILTYPECAFDSAASRPFERVFEDAASALCRGLSSTWQHASHRLVPDPAAARAARGRSGDDRQPIDAYVDFGGLTLQVSVRLPQAGGRPAPFIAGSSTSYLLGGERLLEAAALASADREDRLGRQAARRGGRTAPGAGGCAAGNRPRDRPAPARRNAPARRARRDGTARSRRAALSARRRLEAVCARRRRRAAGS